jgi:RimJ/RimL family protein N-acetyltransferase
MGALYIAPANSPRRAPRLQSERLILREFAAGDLESHAATLGNAEVMRHIGGKALSREDSWRRLLSSRGSWQLLGIGAWAVELESEGRMVGHCGFFDFQRDIQPSIAGEPEMGWIFDPSVHGQGIAFEACSAALAWADQVLRPASYPAIIDFENIASMKLAEKLGFERQEDAMYRGELIALYRRPGSSA